MKVRIAFTVLALALVIAPIARAVDWGVLPNDAWAGDASVNVEYSYTRGTPTGTVIGAAAVMIGPLLPGTPRNVDGDQFTGRGETICLVANAIRGTERSPVVSDCFLFRLGAPVINSPR